MTPSMLPYQKCSMGYVWTVPGYMLANYGNLESVALGISIMLSSGLTDRYAGHRHTYIE